MFRSTHPNSWWWTPDTEFLAAILHATQSGNWQRGGGKGNRPKQVQRPDDRPPAARSSSELAARRAAHEQELARRRARKKGA